MICFIVCMRKTACFVRSLTDKFLNSNWTAAVVGWGWGAREIIVRARLPVCRWMIALTCTPPSYSVLKSAARPSDSRERRCCCFFGTRKYRTGRGGRWWPGRQHQQRPSGAIINAPLYNFSVNEPSTRRALCLHYTSIYLSLPSIECVMCRRRRRRGRGKPKKKQLGAFALKSESKSK